VVAREPGVLLGVLDDRGDPQRRHAEIVEIVELVDDALPVAAVVPARDAGIDVDVVVAIPVLEAIDHDLVDDLIAPVEAGVGLVRLVGGMLEVRGTATGGDERDRDQGETTHRCHGEHDPCPRAAIPINMLLVTHRAVRPRHVAIRNRFARLRAS